VKKKYRRKRQKMNKTLKNIFIEKAKVIHGDTYRYYKVRYINAETNINYNMP
jgi:hypothetical protein